MIGAYFAGTKLAVARVALPSPPRRPNPTDAVPGLRV
jgi:hypothetical protein